jgi:hypothetical protein
MEDRMPCFQHAETTTTVTAALRNRLARAGTAEFGLQAGG